MVKYTQITQAHNGKMQVTDTSVAIIVTSILALVVYWYLKPSSKSSSDAVNNEIENGENKVNKNREYFLSQLEATTQQPVKNNGNKLSSDTGTELQITRRKKDQSRTAVVKNNQSTPVDLVRLQRLAAVHHDQKFHYWVDTENSLYRIYAREFVNDDPVVPPYHPSSKRGQVPIELAVTNALSAAAIKVYWVDYKGKDVDKGTIMSGQTWHQQTYIDHPWVFKRKDVNNATETILLHYIPYKALPMPHEFSIADCNDNIHQCSIIDKLMPYPSQDYLIKFDDCIKWTLDYCQRVQDEGSMTQSLTTVNKYLQNIIDGDENQRLLQCCCIRLSNKTFASNVWLTPARGILLAVGFVEIEGYACLPIESSTLLSETQRGNIITALQMIDRVLA